METTYGTASDFVGLAGQKMLREAGESARTVRDFLSANAPTLQALGERLRASPPRLVLTCARGSSDNAATYGKYLIETILGLPVSSSALSVSSLFDARVTADGMLCIAISQSGASPDLLAAVNAYKGSGALVVAIVNVAESPLAAIADVVLPLCAGPELSVAATKTCIASMAALAALTAHWSGDEALKASLAAMPDQLRTSFSFDWSRAIADVVDGRSLYVLGRGFSFGIAQEAALKLKETAGIHAEAFSAAEVRHGPMAIVGERFPILAFATSDDAGDTVRDTAREFAERGALVLLTDPRGGADVLPALAAHPAIEPVLMLQSFYRFAHSLSVTRGYDPDQPPHLAKVTRTR